MSSVPVVSIIIPTYNHAHFLREALQSLCAQTYPDWEAIVVNNYSEDDTVAVIESFADARIRLENFLNNGVIAASRNRGISLARGKYLAFLDSDDTWYPEKLSKCIERLNQGAALVCHGLNLKGEAGSREVYFGPEQRATFDSLLYQGNCIATSATVVKKEIIELVGGFAENMEFITAEDYHLWLKIARTRARMSFIHEILGMYRIHAGNSSGSVLRNMKAVQQVVESYYSEIDGGLVSRIRVRRRRGIILYAAARAMQDQGDYKNAWPWFFRSFISWPFYLKTYIASLLNAFRRGYY